MDEAQEANYSVCFVINGIISPRVRGHLRLLLREADRPLPGCLQGLQLASCKLWMNVGEQGSAVEPCPGLVCTITRPEALADSAQLWKLLELIQPELVRTPGESVRTPLRDSPRILALVSRFKLVQLFKVTPHPRLPLFTVLSVGVLCALHSLTRL